MFGRFDLLDILLSLPAVFLAFSFHEFAHAFVAYRMGDPTPKMQGRLTLDPLVHVDWIGLIMFAVFGFGWAKPVQTNPSNFKNRKWGDILVSVAGPLTNLALAFFALIITYLLQIAFSGMNYSSGMDILFRILNKVVHLNIVFTFLNLIPIPPFDGYHIVKGLFFKKNVKLFWTLERYSFIILFAMIFLNIFNYLVGIPSAYVFSYLNYFITWVIDFFI